MTDGMPKKLPLYVLRERNRHGKTVFYFRIGKGPRSRLPDINHPDFLASYNDHLRSQTSHVRRKAGAGSLEWLIAQYRDSAAYRAFSPATRKQRDNIFNGVIAKSGKVSFHHITRSSIVNGREDRAATPAQARNYLDAMRGLFQWALEAEHINVDPTIGVKNPKRPKGSGFAAWTDDDIDAYQRRWPRGTKERVWLDVLLYTGLRRGDAVVIGKQHVGKDGYFQIRTQKTGTEVFGRVMPALEDTLRAGPTGDLAWIVGERGQPLTKETFGNMFRAACNAAGLKGKSAHGVRKIGATRAAEDGATTAELEAMFGWTGGTMASHYTKTANRRLLARSGSEKIMNRQTPHPDGNAPHLQKKERKIK